MLIRALQDAGVEYIFGYPGGAALHIYDAIFRQQKVEHILVRHEQAATHMADGYARATGKPGVVLVTSGPGATNAITGIATAFMDSVPMIIVSGQVAHELIGTDAFQETDMVGVSRPVVKHSFMVRNCAEIPEVVRKAFHIATTGRPGPVVIDVPKDTTDPSVVSLGTSITTGPGRPGVAMWNALRTTSGISAQFRTMKLCFTTGRDTPTMSVSWKASVPIRSWAT